MANRSDRHQEHQVDLVFEKTYHLPAFPLPADHADENQYLEHLALRGARERYGDPLPEQVRARFDYEILDYRESDLVKVSILVNAEPVDSLAIIVHRGQSEARGGRWGRIALVVIAVVAVAVGLKLLL